MEFSPGLEEIVTSKLTENHDEFIKFLIETIVTLPFANSDEVLNCLQKIQGIFSMSSDWINLKESNSSILKMNSFY